MNEYSQPGAGKISVHGDGVGAPSPDQVETRAREIAMIAERDPDEFTDARLGPGAARIDRRPNPRLRPKRTSDNAEVVEEWDVVAAIRGHHALRAA